MFRREDQAAAEQLVERIGGAEELPFTSDADDRVQALLNRAILAVECENSLWYAARMPKFGKEMNPKRLAQGKPGFAETAVLPTIIVKDEDIVRLDAWQEHHRIPIHVWHVFFDRAFGIAFDEAKKLFKTGQIAKTVQTFQAPSGAVTRKIIYKIYYHYGYELGLSVEEPTLKAQAIVDKNGHVLPYVTFEGGRLQLSNVAVGMLSDLCSRDEAR